MSPIRNEDRSEKIKVVELELDPLHESIEIDGHYFTPSYSRHGGFRTTHARDAGNCLSHFGWLARQAAARTGSTC
jgi:hypothetical protein